MSNWNTIRKIKAVSLNARKRANIRWDRGRALRDRIAAMEPIQFTGKIVKRIVVIENETTAREIVFYDFDRYTDRKRKLNQVKALAL